MVVLALALAAPSLGLTFGASVVGGIAGIGLGLLAAYVDQSLIYPALFGKSGDRASQLGDLTLGQSGQGTPRWLVLGSRNWVPCQYMWLRNLTRSTSGGGTGKGARPIVQHMRADVGIALGEGPVSSCDVLYADGRPFLAQRFNRATIEDFRWTIAAGTGGSSGRLVVTGQDVEVPDFGTLFSVQDVVRLESVTPTSVLGYWRVAALNPRSATANASIELTPLQGQTPAAAVAGIGADPAVLRRIDQGAVSHQMGGIVGNMSAGITIVMSGTEPTLPSNGFNQQRVRDAFVVGGIYRLSGVTSPAGANGLHRVTAVQFNSVFGFATITIVPADGAVSYTAGATWTPGTATNAAALVRNDVLGAAGFLFQDPTVQVAFYPGDDVQTADPFLAVSEPSPPAFLGLSYFSLQQWDFSPFGHLPELTAVLRSANRDSVSSAVAKICARTMPAGAWDTTQLREKALVGYPVAGGSAGVQALQPLMTMFALATQERGGVITFLDERDLPVVPVPAYHQNARSPGESVGYYGFIPTALPVEDRPQRVLLRFTDPMQEGATGAEGASFASPSDPLRGQGDTLDIDLRPLVVFPYEAKRRANELRRKVQIEMRRGSMRLPPSYLDVLPGHILAFAGANWNEERIPAATSISYTTELRDLQPGSVQLEVRFSTAGRARLRDDGTGVFVGLPAGVTTSVNSINYTTGAIALTFSQALEATTDSFVRYRWQQTWLMRASRARLVGKSLVSELELVSTTIDGPLPPIPHAPASAGSTPIVAGLPQYDTAVIDLPPIYPEVQNGVFVGFAAAPKPGETWRGAGVFTSVDGLTNWQLVGVIQNPTPMGTVAAALPDYDPARDRAVDWGHVLDVTLTSGYQLVGITQGARQYAQIGTGEVVGWTEAVSTGTNTWQLRGLVRGMFGTEVDGTGHAAGEAFVLLSDAFGLLDIHGLFAELPGGFAAVNQTRYFAVIPGGTTVAQYATAGTPYGQRFILGRSCRPGRPVFTNVPTSAQPQGDFSQKGAGASIAITWARSSLSIQTIFGPVPVRAGDFEQYVVTLMDNASFVALQGSPNFLTVDQAILAATRRRIVVGSGVSGGAPRLACAYDPADMTADGFTAGSVVAAFVQMRGQGGTSPRSAILTATVTP